MIGRRVGDELFLCEFGEVDLRSSGQGMGACDMKQEALAPQDSHRQVVRWRDHHREIEATIAHHSGKCFAMCLHKMKSDSRCLLVELGEHRGNAHRSESEREPETHEAAVGVGVAAHRVHRVVEGPHEVAGSFMEFTSGGGEGDSAADLLEQRNSQRLFQRFEASTQ